MKSLPCSYEMSYEILLPESYEIIALQLWNELWNIAARELWNHCPAAMKWDLWNHHPAVMKWVMKLLPSSYEMRFIKLLHFIQTPGSKQMRVQAFAYDKSGRHHSQCCESTRVGTEVKWGNEVLPYACICAMMPSSYILVWLVRGSSAIGPGLGWCSDYMQLCTYLANSVLKTAIILSLTLESRHWPIDGRTWPL